MNSYTPLVPTKAPRKFLPFRLLLFCSLGCLFIPMIIFVACAMRWSKNTPSVIPMKWNPGGTAILIPMETGKNPAMFKLATSNNTPINLYPWSYRDFSRRSLLYEEKIDNGLAVNVVKLYNPFIHESMYERYLVRPGMPQEEIDNIAGATGIQFVENHCLHFDFSTMTITVDPSHPHVKHDTLDMTRDPNTSLYQLALWKQANKPVPLAFFIDFTYSLLDIHSVPKQARLVGDVQAFDNIKTNWLMPQVSVPIKIGAKTINQEFRVTLSNYNIIGNDFLRRFDPYVDFKHNCIHLYELTRKPQPNVQTTMPWHPKSHVILKGRIPFYGLLMKKMASKPWVVLATLPGTSSCQYFHKGDEITEIGGKLVREMSPQQAMVSMWRPYSEMKIIRAKR